MPKSLIARSNDLAEALEHLKMCAEAWNKTHVTAFGRKAAAKDLAAAAIYYTRALQAAARGAK